MKPLHNPLLASPMVAPLLAICVACTDGGTGQPTVTVEARDHRFVVQARGELIASQAVDIRVPDSLNMGFDIAWIVPEYSEVRKGQVIVRFDDTDTRSVVSKSSSKWPPEISSSACIPRTAPLPGP